jgi:hypothetical protein
MRRKTSLEEMIIVCNVARVEKFCPAKYCEKKELNTNHNA